MKITGLALVFLLVFNTLPVTAKGTQSDSGKMAIKVGVGAAVVVGAVCLIRSAVINGKAEKLYRQAESLASAGDWVERLRPIPKYGRLNRNIRMWRRNLRTQREGGRHVYTLGR